MIIMTQLLSVISIRECSRSMRCRQEGTTSVILFGDLEKGVGVLSLVSLDVHESMDAYSREYGIKSF